METQNPLERVHLSGLAGDNKAPRGKFHAIRVYLTPDDYNDIIVRHLGDKQREEYKGCSWVPVELKLNTLDMTIEGTFIPSK